MHDQTDLAAKLTAVVIDLRSKPDFDTAVEGCIEAVLELVPGVDHAGVSVRHREGRLETLAASSQVVEQLEDFQYAHGEGPAVAALCAGDVAVMPGPEDVDLWPHYMPLARDLGVLGQLSLPLQIEGLSSVCLNLYSRDGSAIDRDVATLFAESAAVALETVKHEQDLNAALATRKVIGQALGVLMERYELDEESAFSYLVRVSQSSNIKLRRVAEEVVRITNRRNARPNGSAPDVDCPADAKPPPGRRRGSGQLRPSRGRRPAVDTPWPADRLRRA